MNTTAFSSRFKRAAYPFASEVALLLFFLFLSGKIIAQTPSFEVIRQGNVSNLNRNLYGVTTEFGFNILQQTMNPFDFSIEDMQGQQYDFSSNGKDILMVGPEFRLGFRMKDVVELGFRGSLYRGEVSNGGIYARWYIESGGSDKLWFFLGTSLDYHRPYKKTVEDIYISNIPAPGRYNVYLGSEHFAQSLSAGILYRVNEVGVGLEYSYGWHVHSTYETRLYFRSEDPEVRGVFQESNANAQVNRNEQALFKPHFSRFTLSLMLFF